MQTNRTHTREPLCLMMLLIWIVSWDSQGHPTTTARLHSTRRPITPGPSWYTSQGLGLFICNVGINDPLDMGGLNR